MFSAGVLTCIYYPERACKTSIATNIMRKKFQLQRELQRAHFLCLPRKILLLVGPESFSDSCLKSVKVLVSHA